MTAVDGRRLTLLANPTAGGGRAQATVRALEQALRDRSAEVTTVLTVSGEHAAEATREAAERGDVVAAVGGDGMLRIVASALADRPGATMAAVPAGRGNDFVRSLGLPTEIDAIADMLVGGPAVGVDCGRAVGAAGVPQRFLTIAACGFDSEANRIANDAPSRLGPFVYVWGMIGALGRLRPVPYALTVDGREEAHRGLTVVVANTQSYGGGMQIAPGAVADDGRFDVVVITHDGRRGDRCGWGDRLRLVRALPRLFRGTHVALDAVRVQRAQDVRVAADGPLSVYADGDEIGRLPMTFSVDRGGLSLLVPADHRFAVNAAAGTAVSA